MTPSEILKFYRDSIVRAIGGMGFSAPPNDFTGVVIGGNTYPVLLRNDGCYVYFDERGRRHNLAEVPRADYEFVNIRDVRTSVVNMCYRTPGGQVELRIHTYMNSRDEVLSTKITVINSTDVDHPVGEEIKGIPAEWVEVDCTIAEMTDRELMYVERCYRTDGGKVEIVGIESLDPKINLEKAVYEVMRSTDPDIVSNATYSRIPDDWVRIVCDFPDMTQREITPILKCYDTGSGRVQVEGYKVFDFEMSVRKEWYRIKQSTDPENQVGDVIVGVPDGWEEVVCDFTDMEDRDIEVTTECYDTGDGKVKLEVLTSWDGNIGERTRKYRVVDTNDPAYPVNAGLLGIPEGWTNVVCDFTDMEDRNVFNVSECYRDEAGHMFKASVIYSYDGNIGIRGATLTILESEDRDNYPVGGSVVGVPAGWTRIECSFADKTQRFLDTSYGCYESENGFVKVRMDRIVDLGMSGGIAELEVIQSTDPGHPVGSSPMLDVFADWTEVECDLPDLTQRHIVPVSECYDTGTGKVYLTGHRLLDNMLDVRSESLFVEESTDPAYAVGSKLSSIPDTFVRETCMCNC